MPTLLLGSALFSGSETALFSLSAHQRSLLSQSKRAGALAAATLLVETRALLVTLLVSNMVINVLYFTLSTVLMDRLLDAGSIATTGAAAIALGTFFGVIVFGEVLPKQVAAQQAFAWSGLVGVPLLAIHRTIAPIRITAERLVIAPLARLIAPSTPPPDLSARELEIMLSMSRQRGIIDQDEQQLLRHVLELGQINVRDVMVPRVDIRGHNLDDPIEDLLALARETRLRHIPVYEGSLDQIRGLILTRQLLVNEPTSRKQLQALIKPVYFVPEIAPADHLLTTLREKAVTFAIVVDEYGGSAGLVTLEDVVEHFIGDIPGAYERDGQAIVEQLRDGVFRVGADLAVHDWDEWFGRNPAMSKAASGAATLGGVVLGLLGKAPNEGDRVALGNIVLTVDKVEGRRITSVVVAVADANQAAPSTEEAQDA
ncbi:MAG: hemolysin family protein [Phycisphaeraceae bacterium]|nr:hemolysin family protein [Phycisphaeraceae bacterium]